MIWQLPNGTLDLSIQGEIMGILNVTPDSFSDGGELPTIEIAVARAQEMVAEGARIIDIGGESTRPGAKEVSIDEEIARTTPVIAALKQALPADIALSIDTRKAAVAEAAIDAGAHIVNDVSGFTFDPEMLKLCACSSVGIVLMHMQGTPETMQNAPSYSDVLDEVRTFFATQLATCQTAGIAADRIVFDPGIGFGKSNAHNLALLKDIATLAPAGRPILLGVSRKSFIAKTLGDRSIPQRLAATVAITALARHAGIPLHRVHDVRENHDAIRMTEAIASTK